MKAEAVQFALYAVALVTFAAAQDFMPAMFGSVKPPALMAFALYAASSLPLPRALAWAAAAGAFMDALGGLPALCSLSAFMAAVAGANALRRFGHRSPTFVCAGASALLETWFALWGVSGAEPFVVRFTSAAFLGAATGFVVDFAMRFAERHAGVFGRNAPGAERKGVAP